MAHCPNRRSGAFQFFDCPPPRACFSSSALELELILEGRGAVAVDNEERPIQRCWVHGEQTEPDLTGVGGRPLGKSLREATVAFPIPGGSLDDVGWRLGCHIVELGGVHLVHRVGALIAVDMGLDHQVHVTRVEHVFDLGLEELAEARVLLRVGAVEWSVEVGHDEWCCGPIHSSKLCVHPLLLLGREPRRVRGGLRVSCDEESTTRLPRVVHVVPRASLIKNAGHEEPGLVSCEVVPQFMVPRGDHVRHTAGNGLNLVQKHVPVRHKSIGVGNIARVDHPMDGLVIHQLLQRSDRAVGFVAVAHVAEHGKDKRLRGICRKRCELGLCAPGIEAISHAVGVGCVRLKAPHRGSVNRPDPAALRVGRHSARASSKVVPAVGFPELHHGWHLVQGHPGDAHQTPVLRRKAEVHLLGSIRLRTAGHAAELERGAGS
mmetsp:Transcript_716/g.2291  ORF Transcript_716/g.2291 Transcript_716/m.2291 type:complete len:433 (-) Transcript_716:104-1402(-)